MTLIIDISRHDYSSSIGINITRGKIINAVIKIGSSIVIIRSVVIAYACVSVI